MTLIILGAEFPLLFLVPHKKDQLGFLSVNEASAFSVCVVVLLVLVQL